MKKIITALVLGLTFFGFESCAQKKEKTEFNKDAFSEKLITIEGKEITFDEVLKKHNGKTTIIEVWASWCGDCVKNMPKLKELQAANPTVDFVFLSCDKTQEKWQAGIAKHELQGDQYLIPDGMKGTFGKALDLDWIPRYIIVDKTGKVALYRAIETDHEKIQTTLNTLK
ncbi:TlpA disulfide reductase family protein [Flavobacterium sp.]|uniref:TlpA family protein disulfide reductase n=1 Tax=Flavobacterium sp. TaxID=239 RepID=UPI0028BDA3F0|nr:TlpA disulfide reductase family protein [Flavobacterium sp.]